MAIVQMPRDPQWAAAEAEVSKYGTNLALAGRRELWVLADYKGIEYPEGATKETMIQILRGHDIPDSDIAKIPELVKLHASRFQRQREQAIDELDAMPEPVFPEQEPAPRPDYANMGWNELRKLATSRGIRIYGKQRAAIVSELEALDG